MSRSIQKTITMPSWVERQYLQGLNNVSSFIVEKFIRGVELDNGEYETTKQRNINLMKELNNLSKENSKLKAELAREKTELKKYRDKEEVKKKKEELKRKEYLADSIKAADLGRYDSL